jgi:hypothetical protein
MNKLYLIFILVSLGFTACNQGHQSVPENVLTAFSKKFPAAEKIKWAQENKMEWEAEFKINGKDYSANFDESGSWMETEYAIPEKEIPPQVKTTLENEFSGYKIQASEISETSDGKMNEFELKKGDELIEVSIDLNGNVAKKEETKVEDEEEDD